MSSAARSHLPRFPLTKTFAALWVVRTALTSPAAVATIVASAKASGFNTLLVQVRGRGDAYFLGGLEPRPPSLAGRRAAFTQ